MRSRNPRKNVQIIFKSRSFRRGDDEAEASRELELMMTAPSARCRSRKLFGRSIWIVGRDGRVALWSRSNGARTQSEGTILEGERVARWAGVVAVLKSRGVVSADGDLRMNQVGRPGVHNRQAGE